MFEIEPRKVQKIKCLAILKFSRNLLLVIEHNAFARSWSHEICIMDTYVVVSLLFIYCQFISCKCTSSIFIAIMM